MLEAQGQDMCSSMIEKKRQGSLWGELMLRVVCTTGMVISYDREDASVHCNGGTKMGYERKGACVGYCSSSLVH